MTRLLYWNIENFALNKINDPCRKRKKRGASLNDHEKSVDQRLHILWMIQQVNPDIFILVEVETAFRGVGQLVKEAGRDGIIELLHHIQGLNADWSLVPPLQTGPNEAVAIFYRNTNRHFTGPYVWPGGHAAVSQQPGGGVVPANYPARYLGFLPNRLIPAAAHDNPNVNERQVAARINYTYKAGHATPGAAVAFPIQRAPYMVTFYETGLARNLTLFAIHAPASNNAKFYLRNLADYAQIVDGLAPNEVRVVVGDFNWNLLKTNYTRRASYDPLCTSGFNLALQPLNPVPVALPNGYFGYFATHILRRKQAVYWSTAANITYYPGYGYITNRDYAIDNVFTRYGAGAGGPAANFTIMNPIVGSPYNVHMPAPPIPPTGTIILPIEMVPVLPTPQPGAAHNPGLMTTFRDWEHYGHIIKVSDHLALAIDI